MLDMLLRERMVPMDLLIPYTHGDLVNLAHTHGFIEEVEHLENGTHLRGRIPLELAGRYRGYWFNPANEGHFAPSGADQLEIDEYVETDLSFQLDDENDNYPPYSEADDDIDGVDREIDIDTEDGSTTS
jgi:hypothetical protein